VAAVVGLIRTTEKHRCAAINWRAGQPAPLAAHCVKCLTTDWSGSMTSTLSAIHPGSQTDRQLALVGRKGDTSPGVVAAVRASSCWAQSTMARNGLRQAHSAAVWLPVYVHRMHHICWVDQSAGRQRGTNAGYQSM
jgi:hypothetical protein